MFNVNFLFSSQIQGYCDAFRKCRQVDAEGPLVRLKNLLLGERALTSAREWLTENWWVVILAAVGLIVTTGMMYKMFSYVPRPYWAMIVLCVFFLPN